MIFISLISLVFFACSVRLKQSLLTTTLYKEGFEKDNTDAIRGLLALCIVLCHMTSRVDYQLPVVRFVVMGVIGVATFFFLSGYSLTKAALEKEEYFSHFFAKRITRILLPYLIFLSFYSLVMCLFFESSLHEITHRFLIGSPVSNSWYVIAIMFFYAFFHISFFRTDFQDRKQLKKSILLFVALSAVYILLCIVLHLPEFWYETCPLMLLGIIYACYEAKIREQIGKHYFLILCITCVLCVGAYLFPALWNRIVRCDTNTVWLINDILMALTFTGLIVLLMLKSNVRNRITLFLGKLSFEIYLSHGMVMEILLHSGLTRTRFGQECFGLLTVAITLVLSAVLHSVFSILQKKTNDLFHLAKSK